jgi:hypothetical protein
LESGHKPSIAGALCVAGLSRRPMCPQSQNEENDCASTGAVGIHRHQSAVLLNTGAPHGRGVKCTGYDRTGLGKGNESAASVRCRRDHLPIHARRSRWRVVHRVPIRDRTVCGTVARARRNGDWESSHLCRSRRNLVLQGQKSQANAETRRIFAQGTAVPIAI